MTKQPAAPDVPPASEPATAPFENLVPGRIVHYHPTLTQERQTLPGPWASIVTRIHELPGVVTLNVMLPVPTSIGTDPVQRMSEVPYGGDVEDKAGKWTWPER